MKRYRSIKEKNFTDSQRVCKNMSGVMADVTTEQRTESLAQLLTGLSVEAAFVGLLRKNTSSFSDTDVFCRTSIQYVLLLRIPYGVIIKLQTKLFVSWYVLSLLQTMYLSSNNSELLMLSSNHDSKIDIYHNCLNEGFV
ncbi:hypothetical protein K1T71_006127 [Dendrolimus kikuchii]|uniref:Uncharacterized protein n=1 Tax=Dendrolimus kikuchii TaxID=765133 RepID=A0ACC1D2X9_9NEOP|nr:hypothetical protein K1T71_006127 [Dendrolimus kikuchii]